MEQETKFKQTEIGKILKYWNLISIGKLEDGKKIDEEIKNNLNKIRWGIK